MAEMSSIPVGVWILPLIILISFINNLSMKLQLSSGGKLIVHIFGIIGVPIHEFSHYIFCLMFRHHVDSVSFFSPNWENGQLGCVKHSYNKYSMYQRVGQVFISLAPMIVGTILLNILSNAFNIHDIGLKSMMENPNLILKYITFVYIFMCISSYMICSFQDFKNCFGEFICIIVCIFVCMLLLPGIFEAIYGALLMVLKLVMINFVLSFLMFFFIGRLRAG